MAVHIEGVLLGQSIAFSHLANRLQCFPHIINLAAQDFVEALTCTPSSNVANLDFLSSVQMDVVARCRELVVACQMSSVRREEWRRTIVEFNQNASAEEKVPTLALIHDVVTRWSSTFQMIDRFLTMQQVVKAFLAKNYMILCEKGLSPTDIEVLCHVHKILQVFNHVQELLSSERTPTLSLVLPV
ncbi:hypothetical protein CPB86DRAFT_853707 [Serendipita vermifera]|nr:hypothetical protein CPB86DRAFT_853707 [Serendipita vermifera]